MRKMYSISAILIALVAGLALSRATAAQGTTQVGVTLTEFKVSMASTSIPAGVPVTFTATNHGQMMHELVLEKAGAVDQPFEMNGKETEIEDIAPGTTKSATWTFTQPGEYQVACHLPGHFEAGMVERFTVTAATGGQAPGAAQMQPAAPSGENQAEHEGQPAGSAPMAMAAAPATLPVTGAPAGSPILWLVAAAGFLTAAVGGGIYLMAVKIGAGS